MPNPVKKFKIIIDPGHGGTKQAEFEIYGDKYDPITSRYLEPYKNGASFQVSKTEVRTEMEIVLDLGKEVKSVLDLTLTKKGFQKFQSYIKIFSDSDAPWIKIESVMTRNDNYKDRNFREKDDKNADYRLYDYPDFVTGKMKQGRLSFINNQEAYLCVSLHINDMGSRKGYEKGGMGVVLAPSYQTFDMLKRISEKSESPESFYKSNWNNWMIFESGWNQLENAMADAWIYFNGYWPNKSGNETNIERFEGYRYNMVTWSYSDEPGWEKKVSNKEGPYAIDHKLFRPTGKFWDREREKPEIMRRENGPEGFGGDNHYAGAELLRFLQYGLRAQADEDDQHKEPGTIVRPFVSTYSLPTFINSISAYLELGDIASDRDMYFVTKKKKKAAIALAVGIYSLINGLEIRNSEYPIQPKGKRLEFEKYISKTGENYFLEAKEKHVK